MCLRSGKPVQLERFVCSMLRVWSREKLKIGRKEGRVVRVGERGEKEERKKGERKEGKEGRKKEEKKQYR